MTESGFRSLLGAYVSDLLDPGERELVHSHMSECPACRLEADELSAIAHELRGGIETQALDPARLDAAELEAEGRLLDNELVLQRTLRSMRAERSRRQGSRAFTALAAAAVVLIGGVVVGAALAPGDDAGVASATSSVRGARTVSARDPKSGVRMTATIIPQAGFSRVSARIRYEPPNVRCELVAIGMDGTGAIVSSWAVGPHGSGARGTHVTGSAAISINDLRRLDVQTLDGAPVVSVKIG